MTATATPAAPQSVTHNSRAHLAAVALFAGSLVLIATDAPPWCTAFGFASCAWRFAIGLGWLAVPRQRRGMRFVFGAATAICVFAVLASFRTLNGLGAGTALLVLMGALKLLESKSQRDDAIVVGVSLFMLLAASLASQSLLRLPFYLLFVAGACASMALIAHPGVRLPMRAAARLSGRALAMAIPLAVAGFLFFPRFSGQFWALERGGQASTGLGEEMAPGAIGTLANEYDIAFRVNFEKGAPAREALYFRGPVLNTFDGFTWRRDGAYAYPEEKDLEFLGEPIRYQVTLEPTWRRTVFTLDTAVAAPRRGMRVLHDRQIVAMDEISNVTTYQAVSHLRTRSQGALSPLGRRYETRLPGDRNPRTRALAVEMRARAASDADYARDVLKWFEQQQLQYTLDPGMTSVDSVDTTLFDSKLGFCAHFASAYATMMRAAGVPARIVTGYLGGEWNPAGDYLVVRQTEAHAWTEIWLDGQGWTRVDPTEVVMPERLQRGLFDLMPNSLSASSRILRTPWIYRLSQLWDGANQWWQSRVVEFSLRNQLDLLRKLGIGEPDLAQLGYGFSILLLAWIAWIAVSLRRSVARVKPDRIGRAWLKATRKLARVTAPRAADEGPVAYAARVGEARPDLAPVVTEIARRYSELRYGRAAANDDVEALEREVRRLSV